MKLPFDLLHQHETRQTTQLYLNLSVRASKRGEEANITVNFINQLADWYMLARVWLIKREPTVHCSIAAGNCSWQTARRREIYAKVLMSLSLSPIYGFVDATTRFVQLRNMLISIQRCCHYELGLSISPLFGWLLLILRLWAVVINPHR
jgi:hypothetical protein